MAEEQSAHPSFAGRHTAQIIRLKDRVVLPSSGRDPLLTLVMPIRPGTVVDNLMVLRQKIEAAGSLIGRVDPSSSDAFHRIGVEGWKTAKVDTVLCQLWKDLDQMLRWPDTRTVTKVRKKRKRARQH